PHPARGTVPGRPRSRLPPQRGRQGPAGAAAAPGTRAGPLGRDGGTVSRVADGRLGPAAAGTRAAPGAGTGGRPRGAAALATLAESFWERVSCPLPWPRDLEPVIPQGAPVWVVPLADLSPAVAQDWLRRRGLDLPLGLAERPLDGCILAFRGQAVV